MRRSLRFTANATALNDGKIHKEFRKGNHIYHPHHHHNHNITIRATGVLALYKILPT